MPTNTQSETTYHLRDGAVVVAKRPNTAKWQMRIKRPDGTWEIKSTKTNNLNDAKNIASERYDDLRFRQKHEMPLDDERRFKDAIAAYEKQLLLLQGTGGEKPIHKTYLQILDKWIKPFFGNYKLRQIDSALLEEYDNHLRNGMEKEPAKSTFNSHNVVIRAVFDVAVTKKWITRGELPIPTVKGKGKKAVRRPHFEADEWRRMTQLLRGKWLTGSKQWTSNYKRQVLRIYVLILGNTGMRPGAESLNLKWKDVSTYKMTAAQFEQAKKVAPDPSEVSDKVVRFRVVGKTSKNEAEGFRRVLARHNVEGWLNELKEITKNTADDDYLFCMPDGTQIADLPNMFKEFLQTHDLLLDPSNYPRTLYSLRHMYATFAVRKEVPYNELAKQMGTSVEMIERHYDKNTVEQFAVHLAY